ncbi:MAG: hypothetical protein R3C56_40245 [Pirellulaceae bacterium]
MSPPRRLRTLRHATRLARIGWSRPICRIWFGFTHESCRADCPEGAAAFNELVQLGVKTIITVDGAQPDVATAKQFGLRYVHLPHGYDGIPENRVAELAKRCKCWTDRFTFMPSWQHRVRQRPA